MPGLGSALSLILLLTASAAVAPAQIADFLSAARADDIATLQKMIGASTPVNARGPHGRTALHEAAANCRVNAVRFLIEHGAEMSALDDSSATPADLAMHCPAEIRPYFRVPALSGPPAISQPMQNAISHHQTQVVSMLVTLGFNVNAPSADGDRPLNIAAAAGGAEIMKILLEHGADPNLPGATGYAPLHDAALHGDSEAINLLLAHGAHIDTPTPDDGSTALHLAASFDRLDAVKTLVRHGADTTLRNAKGLTAADLAAKSSFTDVSAFLASTAR
ncbi:MAG TPA: ankyrin repeat domain-containing protein [Bryobacteraceae bacterium]|nr:ankyrin repeat domain-containing protein [Bryobacteraceae bacterium]